MTNLLESKEIKEAYKQEEESRYFIQQKFMIFSSREKLITLLAKEDASVHRIDDGSTYGLILLYKNPKKELSIMESPLVIENFSENDWKDYIKITQELPKSLKFETNLILNGGMFQYNKGAKYAKELSNFLYENNIPNYFTIAGGIKYGAQLLYAANPVTKTKLEKRISDFKPTFWKQ